MENEENFVENLVVPALKLFGNKIVRRRNGLQRNWRHRSCIAKKSWALQNEKIDFAISITGK